MRPLEFLSFVRHYFPTFIGGIFSGIFSIACVLVLYVEAFYRRLGIGQDVIWIFGGALFALGFLCVCHFFLIWGRVIWVWGVGLLFFICLCLIIPAIEYRPTQTLYFLGVLSPLIGFLILNSNRHREMRKILVSVRHKRERFLGIRKARTSRLNVEQHK